MDLSSYYHAFLGNGIDAVLVGYTGSMVPDRINGPDRCYWYKADRYYPPEIPVLPALDRRTLLGPAFRPQPGEPWHELAPLARCWYEPAPSIHQSRQRFDPTRAVLESTIEGPAGTVRVTTFLHAAYPLLVERYEFPAPTRLRLFCGPGPWTPGPDDLEPFTHAEMAPGPVPTCGFTIGSNAAVLGMVVEPAPARWGLEERALWVDVQGPTITRYCVVVDSREERLPGGPRAAFDRLTDLIQRDGFDRLYAGHTGAWQAYRRRGADLEVADQLLARVFALTPYQIKAAQHPVSGALPVNNLRATWSSHVFWDAGFMHLAQLQSGYTSEAELACAFLERLRPRASEHARAYGARGLKYDWEITHDGTPAYGVHRHLVHQVHNNAMYSLMCWHQYAFTRDRELLRRFYPIIHGVAEFFLSGVVQPGPTIRAVTGINEMAQPVALDAATLAGTVQALRLAAQAAEILGEGPTFGRRCSETADGLRRLFSTLTRDGILYANETGELSWGVLPACSLMEILAADDPVALATTRAFARRNRSPSHGIVGHGAAGRGPQEGFPWVAGWLATILASAGAPGEAYELLRPLDRAVSAHGGLPEKVLHDGRWNMQYFTTAQAAVVSALHAFVVHFRRGRLDVTAPPWPGGSFQGLHVNGLAVSGTWEGERITRCLLRNVTRVEIEQPVRVNGRDHPIRLHPNEEVILG